MAQAVAVNTNNASESKYGRTKGGGKFQIMLLPEIKIWSFTS